MEREEWAAREMVTSLDEAQRTVAIFQRDTLGRHVTQNQAYVTPLENIGISVSVLDANRQALVTEIIHKYLDTLPDLVSASHLDRVQAAGFENITFAWAGPLEAQRPHYYRLQGPTFLLEHDNSRNRGTHIHSMWRDFAEDSELLTIVMHVPPWRNILVHFIAIVPLALTAYEYLTGALPIVLDRHLIIRFGEGTLICDIVGLNYPLCF
jgi:hypothetical protein